jgi:hypothetical protein
VASVDEFAAFLDSSSTRFTVGTNLWVNWMPDEPDTAATIYETGGLAPVQRFGNDLPAFERPGFQMICRAAASSSARANIHAAWTLAQQVANEELSSKTWLRIEPLQSPFFLERDPRGRYVYAVNFVGMRATTST